MTLDFDMEDLFSSDIELYNLLSEIKNNNQVLSNFFISFPDGDGIKNRPYGIFIGDVRNNLKQQTSTGDSYTSTVRVLITSKQSDFKKAKAGIDLATKEIIKEVRKSDLSRKNFRWTESQIIYNEKFALKYRAIDFLFDEMYTWKDTDYDKRIIELLFKPVEITKEMED